MSHLSPIRPVSRLLVPSSHDAGTIHHHHPKNKRQPITMSLIPIQIPNPFQPEKLSLRKENLRRPPHIIAIPPRTAPRLFDVVRIRPTSPSLSAAPRRPRDRRAIPDIRFAAAAPGSGELAYSPQPQEQQGAGDRADDYSCDCAAGDCTWAAGA